MKLPNHSSHATTGKKFCSSQSSEGIIKQTKNSNLSKGIKIAHTHVNEIETELGSKVIL